MADIKKYTVNVPQDKIDRLHRRIDEMEWPTELSDAPEWQYGLPL